MSILERWNQAIVKVLADPGVKDALNKHGLTPQLTTRAELTDFMKKEDAKWKAIVRDRKTVLSLRELAGKNWQLQTHHRQLTEDDVCTGMEELGVLLLGHPRKAYWYGSRLGIEEARALCPLSNATSLQTTAGVLGGVVWTIRHPQAGVVDPDEMDFREVMAVATPYLDEMVGVNWTPLDGRGILFAEDVDRDDPWQFSNILVT